MSASQRQQHNRQASSASDDWAPATIVSNFDDDSSNVQQGQASDPSSSLPDWDQWQDFASSSSIAAGPSNSKVSSSGLTLSLNQADDDFFAALERSTPGEAPAAATAAAAAAAGGGEGLLMPTMATPPIPHPRPPSPPEIDLEQRRIEERDRQLRASGIVGSGGGGGGGSATKTGAGGSDDDWFAKFERDLKSGRGRSGSQPRPELGSDQLESMREAHASPLPTPLRAKQAGNGHASGDDYFSQATTAGATRLPPPPSAKQQPQAQPQAPGNNSWWGSIRHLGSDWAHRAADYLDPGVDFSDEELKLARKMGAIDLDSRSATPVGGAAVGRGTPSRGGSRSSSVAPAPQGPARGAEQQRKGSSSSAASAPAAPPAKLVSGAPGVDFSSLNPRWNAGNWTLPSDDPSSSSSRSRMASAERLATASPSSSGAARKLKPLPVTLTGRREDSSPVVTDGHAAHIQPHLPPRLKLGRTWRLCYSSDQHGISLETLYSRVGRCMDAKPGANGDGEEGRNGSSSSSSAAYRQDGWLRGASSATRAALGSDDAFASSSSRASSSSAAPPRLGSGLTSMRDAGLILAVRDEQDNVFGAFLNERLTRAHRGYYGNGECFLFRQVRSKGEEEEVRVYGATARNNFYALGETGYLAFGGSSAQYQAERAAKAKGSTRHTESSSRSSTASSGYGLWLDSDFSHGVTARCETFENVPLAQSGEEADRAADRRAAATEKGGSGGGDDGERWEKEIKFEPVIVEVWAVGLD